MGVENSHVKEGTLKATSQKPLAATSSLASSSVMAEVPMLMEARCSEVERLVGLTMPRPPSLTGRAKSS